MNFSANALILAAVCTGALISSQSACADVDRAQLVSAMKSNCYTSNADAAPSEKAKCECFARTFVQSLTAGEIAVPKPSAAINAKLGSARHICHMGE